MIIKTHKCKNILHPFPVIAWLIMIFQKMMPWNEDSYSHIVLSTDDDGVVTFYEINFGGMLVSDEEDFLKKYRLVDSHTFKEEDSKEKYLAWFSTHNKKRYDFFQLIGLALKVVGITRFNRMGEDLNKLICSELALDYAAKRYDLSIRDFDNYDMVGAWDLITNY